MGEPKNIDRLFQEQFKDFEQAPDNKIWDNIEKELKKDLEDNNKKTIPIWIRWTGIAASLLLLISLSITLLNTEKKPNTTIVDGSSTELPNNKSNGDLLKENSLDKTTLKKEENQPITLTSKNTSELKNKIILNTSEPSLSNQVDNKQKEPIVINHSNDKTIEVNNNSNQNNYFNKNNNNLENQAKLNNYSLVSSKTSIKKSQKTNINKEVLVNNTTKNSNRYLEPQINDDIAANNTPQLKKANKSFNSLKNPTNSIDKSNDLLVHNSTKKSELSENMKDYKNETNEIDNTEDHLITSNNKDNTDNKEIENPSNNSSNVIANIKNESVENRTVNSESLAEHEEKAEENNEELKEDLPSIQEAIAEQKEKEQKDENENDEEQEPFNRWKVQPNIAPVYYNTLSSGSPIDSQFKSNKKKGQINMSYGLNFSYALNKRLKVRSGINQVELGYKTENVAVVPFEEGNRDQLQIKNISTSGSATHLNVSSTNGFAVSQIPETFRNLFDSSLSQKFGYLEVPLELSYQISNKKLKIDVIAGMSSFFLNKNEIQATNEGRTTYLGEANNLNKTVFSTNLGFGLNYQLSKSFSLNVEPTFKYQLNSFSNDAGNFKPYILGIYSGFSFKF